MAAGVGLVVLIAMTTIGSSVTSRAATKSADATRIGDAYGHAATAVAAEESLERKYRLAARTGHRGSPLGG